jgi:hypothetical protein
MYRFLAAFAGPISQSAPHIYLSAAPLAPVDLIVSKHYLPQHKHTLSVQAGVGPLLDLLWLCAHNPSHSPLMAKAVYQVPPMTLSWSKMHLQITLYLVHLKVVLGVSIRLHSLLKAYVLSQALMTILSVYGIHRQAILYLAHFRTYRFRQVGCVLSRLQTRCH